MTIKIRAADGAIVQFQDGTPPAIINRAMQQDHMARAIHVIRGRQAEQSGIGPLHGASLGLQSGLPGFPEVGAGMAAGVGAIDNMAHGRPANFGGEWARWRAYQAGLHGQFRNDHPIEDSFLRGSGYVAQGALALATGGESTAASLAARQAAQAAAKRSALALATGGESANALLASQQAARLAAKRAVLALTGNVSARLAPNAFTGAATAAINGAAQPGTLSERVRQGVAAIPGGALFGVAAPEVVGLAGRGIDLTANALDGARIPWPIRLGKAPEMAARETPKYPFKVIDGDGPPPTDWRSPKKLRDRPTFRLADDTTGPEGTAVVKEDEGAAAPVVENAETPEFVHQPSRDVVRRSRQVQYAAAVDRLLAQGVPLTPGQRSGGLGRQLEDTAMASPKLGASIRQARLQAEMAVMRSEANRWLSPTNEQLPDGLNVGPDMATYVAARRNAYHDEALGLVKNTTADEAYKKAAMSTLSTGHEVITKAMWDDLMRKHMDISASLENPLTAAHLRDMFSDIDSMKEYYGEDGSKTGKWQRELFGQLGSGLSDLLARKNPLYNISTTDFHAGQDGFDTWRGAMNRLGSANIDFTPGNLKSGILVQDAGSPLGINPENGPAKSQLLDDAAIVMGPQPPLPVERNSRNPVAGESTIPAQSAGNPGSQIPPNSITALSRAVAAQQGQRSPDGSYDVDIDQSTNPDFIARTAGPLPGQ